MDAGALYHVTFFTPRATALRAPQGSSEIRVPNREQNDPSIHTSHHLLERVGEVLGEALARTLAPGLYLVATPIGNLGDVSLRALSVLARANIIAAEDTRHSRKLLSHFGVTGELTPYHEHNAARERPRLLARIRAGSAVALISDAGTPLISDPGYKLVREALDAGFLVSAIPGPSAALAALTSSGLPTDTFLFAGFLPPKSGPRRTRIEELKSAPATLVFFEASSRVAKSLADMASALGPREAVVAKELTKLHEGLTRGLLNELAAHFAELDELKGEFVIVVAPPSAEDVSATDDVIVASLTAALQKESFRDAVRSVAENLNVKRSRVYELGLALERGDDAP